ncbi:uncharacterized protein BP01DRAFT_352809 [Aspergillus saccharolyticus JOP 1030-1]|uniref:GPI anchored cell wall protein n=1 Tax=Aspergillus saccharolyticus JOP 1030-1 TaxID=1450539 RepID=A0A319ACA4_9EURO|nr:hypothetical protein BP01DRAFT_352809 [Aspergillus saccharolyticus JOP 1030-1]PYH49288.1 hypothetical protein BP01DRAFT_352809 [Aspergillus saccharolyticus JOP 1030-1]
MRVTFLLAAALSVLTTSADDTTTTVGFYVPDWEVTLPADGQRNSTGASVVGINTAATTYHLGCLKDAPKTDCDIDHSWTIVQGPSTVSVSGVYTASTSDKSQSFDVTVTQSMECSLKAWTESASCSMSVGMTGSLDGGSYSSSTSTHASYTTTATLRALLVTGGVKSLTEPAATKTDGAAKGNGAVGAMITAAPVIAAAAAALL